jgi:hypothetical protein
MCINNVQMKFFSVKSEDDWNSRDL